MSVNVGDRVQIAWPSQEGKSIHHNGNQAVVVELGTELYNPVVELKTYSNGVRVDPPVSASVNPEWLTVIPTEQ